MSKKRKIAPSILAADFSWLCEQIHLVEKGGAELIHVDVMDGHFVPNITVGPVVVSSIRKCTDKFLDVHLMIENPGNYIDAFAKAGADNITFHIEATDDPAAVIKKIKTHNIRAGISIKPATPLSVLHEYIHQIDLLLIMSVEPGFGGQKFISASLDKLRQAQILLKSNNLTNVDIEVDGGVDLQNIKEIVDAGADIIVAGSEIFHSKDPTKKVQEMYRIVNS
jgi:ribulose-phosphate 3-epimerase